MLERRVGRQDRVVRLDNGTGKGRRRVHAELELGLLPVVRRQALKDERAEAGPRPTTEGMEDEEALQTIAVVHEAANLVHHDVDLLLADRVVATGVWVATVNYVAVAIARDYAQLLAASSLPVIIVSGWKRLR